MTYDSTFYDLIAPGCRASAAVVVPWLHNLFSPERVLDVGCGEGHWLAEFAALGCEVRGIDGVHVPANRLAIPPECFSAVDLASSWGQVAFESAHDLTLSLEVAEHLPPSAAEGFVAGLVATAPIVVFSAAIPGQGGVGHLNEQWPRYWWDLFHKHGYLGTGALRFVFWDDDRVENWYRQNLFVYAHPSAFPAEAAHFWAEPWRQPYALVHPVLFDARR